MTGKDAGGIYVVQVDEQVNDSDGIVGKVPGPKRGARHQAARVYLKAVVLHRQTGPELEHHDYILEVQKYVSQRG